MTHRALGTWVPSESQMDGTPQRQSLGPPRGPSRVPRRTGPLRGTLLRLVPKHDDSLIGQMSFQFTEHAVSEPECWIRKRSATFKLND